MEYRVEYSPAYSVLKVLLQPGESIVAEPGSYMMYRGDIEVKTSTLGLTSAIARLLAGGESLFFNTITARSQAEVWIAPETPGDIKAVRVEGELIVQDTS